jgi:uronate dehydrogenase
MLVLITGASGEVGRGVVPLLEKEFDLRLLSLDPPEADPRRIQADLLDWDALHHAMNRVDAVLHLAVAPGHSGTFEEDRFNDRRFDINVKGTSHVLETARRLKVLRLVHVSSVMVTWGHAASGRLIPGDASPSPVGTYALTKTLAEEVVRYHADRWHAPGCVITLRIAAPLDVNDPELRHKKVRPQQIPFPDLAQAFSKALTVPLTRYEIVTATGASSRPIWDLEPARRVLGYQPQYYLDDLGVTFASPFEVDSV